MTRLLVVDDEPVVRDVLRRLLEQPGREVLVAAGAEDALQCAQSFPLDVALIDKNLIGTSGLDVSRQLKALQPELEVILLTGYASIESAIEAVKIGAFDYLTKPIDDYNALSMKVRSAEEKSALRRGQRELVQQLMESELRFRRLVESNPDALVVYDAETGSIVDANPAAIALYGYAPEELMRLRVDDLRPARDETGAWATSSGPTLESHWRKGEQSFPCEVVTTELRIEGRSVRVLTARDVSERERTRADKGRLEEQLRVAQKMDAVGRLAGGVAHDFNNLLAVIQAHADFLSQQLPPASESHAELEGILRASTRGAALTRQLLLFSRHKPIEFGQVDVNAVVTDVQKLLARVIGAPIQVAVQLDANLPQVKADADQLSQVVLNLAVNARDAMPRGGRLSISTSAVDLVDRTGLHAGDLQPGRYVCLSVEDTGDGMDFGVLSRLFEPFFTTKDPGKGTGLGLTTVYGIVRSSGGAIDVRSQEGKGSAFIVYLPVTENGAQPSWPAPQPRAQGRGETILVVEDDEKLRVLVRRILTANGYTVVEHATGREALRAALDAASPLDLLVTDIVMPEMSGRDLAEQIQRVRPGVRVLFMTGYTQQAVQEIGPSVGFLLKPFPTTALLGQVRRLLDR